MDHWGNESVLKIVEELRPRAVAAGGAASVRLAEFPRHYTEIAFRVASGIGELHHNWADTFFILEGTAELVTGDEMVEARVIAPGEERGRTITGTARRRVAAGDVIHIPAGQAHQMILSEGETVAYFVLKIQERE